MALPPIPEHERDQIEAAERHLSGDRPRVTACATIIRLAESFVQMMDRMFDANEDEAQAIRGGVVKHLRILGATDEEMAAGLEMADAMRTEASASLRRIMGMPPEDDE